MNLITDPWIPVVRRDGQNDLIAPWQIAETENPVVEINAPRPDFQGALYQFLIGLLQTYFAPEDKDQWIKLWREIPKSSDLASCFSKGAFAFELDISNGPAFMQEHLDTKNHNDDFAKAELLPIEDLIGGALSDNTRKGNKDLFVKSGKIKTISPYFAALGLYNMQISGVLAWGQHRVGLRGNAPLTTLILPDDKRHDQLWKKLWLNVICQEDLDLLPGDIKKNHPSDIHPWLAKTRISPNKESTSPSDAHPLQHYWPMPRRIKLKIENVEGKYCDLTGIPIKQGVSYYQRVPDGVYYTNGWMHPLTPYTRSASDQFPKAIGGSVAAEGFRQWVALNYDEYFDNKNKKMRWGRAFLVNQFYEERRGKSVKTRLWCFGYDANNANVKCWYESLLPTFDLTSVEINALKSHVSDLLQIAYQLVDELIESLIRAWFRPQINSNGKQSWNHAKSTINKAGHLSTYRTIKDEYWEQLEADFSESIFKLIKYGNTSGRPFHIYKEWLKAIQKHCLKYFDNNALNEAIEESDMRRAVDAKQYLLNALYPKKKGLIKDVNDYNSGKEVVREK
jgi:CRISPR system Cascade subunit CasA